MCYWVALILVVKEACGAGVVDAPALEFAQSKPADSTETPGSFGDDLDLPEFFR